MDLWEKCVDFHGHHCGGLRIGYAAAMYAMELLNVSFSDNEQVVCILKMMPAVKSCVLTAARVTTVSMYNFTPLFS